MTTLAQARQAILAEFITTWGATTDVALDNEEFKPTAGASWVRVTIRHNPAFQETLGPEGDRKFERPGTVFVQVFTALDGGRSPGDTLAETARGIFEGKTLSGVRFNAVSVQEIGPLKGWYQHNVEAIFAYTDRK